MQLYSANIIEEISVNYMAESVENFEIVDVIDKMFSIEFDFLFL